MNILIVDDDRFVIAALNKNIDWTGLGITSVFTAGNIFQAQEVFQNNDIDILLSDIEMPGGSGLELLSWLRQEHYEVQAIFLTNYANFNYAQKAIALQSFEYYLKPIEFNKLSLIIEKAVQKVHSMHEEKQIRAAGELWRQHESQRSVSFWQTYFKMLQHMEHIELQPLLAQYHLNYPGTELFLCCIADIFPYRLSEQMELISLRESQPDLTNRFRETAADACPYDFLTLESFTEHPSRKDRFYLVFRLSDPERAHMAGLAEIIEKLQSNFHETCGCDTIFHVGNPEALDRLASAFYLLTERADSVLPSYNQTFYLSDPVPVHGNVPPFNAAALEYQLSTGNPDAFVKCASQYLHRCIKNGTISSTVAANFRLDITQLVFSYLASNEILAHNLFDNKTYAILLENAERSIPDLENFLRYLGHTALHYIRFSSQKASVVEQICQYIEKNYQNDISRNDFAKIVYLNPDHIARIFRKETGISLGSYIIQKRIEAAKNLLENTGLPINSIADKVGYGNYSYFTKLFKKETGYTPNEYRQLARQKQETEDFSS